MLKRTPLFDETHKLGARFTEFAGWELPLYYTGIVDEHMAVRADVGIFDISHLGKLVVKGRNAMQFVQRVATNDIGKLAVGRGVYTLFCVECGGIVDDEIVFRLADDEYLLVPNAAQVGRMVGWLDEQKPDGITITDRTEELCLLALQGPRAPELLAAVFNENPATYKRYMVKNVTVDGYEYMVMRSGYTGEEGYEILCGPEAGTDVFRRFRESGATPCGLGARDTLRLEMGFPLYGKDITLDTTPIEAGLERFVAFDKGDFIGKDVLLKEAQKGPGRKLVGFILDEGIARGGEDVLSMVQINERIGTITSGGYSPILKKGIGMAYVKTDRPYIGQDVYVRVRDKMLAGRLTDRPIVKLKKSAAA